MFHMNLDAKTLNRSLPNWIPLYVNVIKLYDQVEFILVIQGVLLTFENRSMKWTTLTN